MSAGRPDRGAPAVAPPETSSRMLVDEVTELPTFPLVLGRMRKILETHGWIGLITVNVVQEGPSRDGGPQMFDDVLRDLAAFLEELRRTHLRASDEVADLMMNGNTFVILLSAGRDRTVPVVSDLEAIRARLGGPVARFLTERIPGQLADGIVCRLGCAISVRDPRQRPERLIYRALDDAVRGSVPPAGLEAPQDPARSLRHVLLERAVHPVYQPVVDLVRGRVIGYEALSRVPGHLFRDVEHLFRVAQEANVIWQLERLCREKALDGLGSLPQEMSLFLNVEPDSVSDPLFRSDETIRRLEQAGLTPDRVVLEVTEHSGVKDFGAFREMLAHFRACGFRLALDDVGSAYSGLQSIAEMAPDYIKIDMSLTRDLHRNGIKKDLVQTIARFSRDAGIQLIAEGVETLEELRELRKIGVALAQGFLFAQPQRPRPEARLDALALTSL